MAESPETKYDEAKAHEDTPPPPHKAGEAKADDKKATRTSNRKRNKILLILGIIFGVILLLWLLYWLIWGRLAIYTDDAYVGGNLVRIMPQIPGTITGINTDNTLLVNEGQVLITLDKADTRIALDSAKATLAQTVRDTRQLYERVIQAQSLVALRKADLDKSLYDLKRRQGLIGEKAISREEMQHYQTFVDTAQAQYNDARATYEGALAQVVNTTLYNHPQVLRARVNMENAYINFQRTTLYAPATGYVAQRTAQVGQQVAPSTSLMAVIPLDQVWIDANYKESQLERIRIGQPVSVKVDAYGDFEFHGKILGLTPGTGGSFDLLPPQNATGNWIKIVQRVPVRIYLDPDEVKKHPLLIGLSARVTTHTDNLDGRVISQTANQQTLYSTDIFSKQLADADKMIDGIVRANGANISLETLFAHYDSHKKSDTQPTTQQAKNSQNSYILLICPKGQPKCHPVTSAGSSEARLEDTTETEA